MEHDYDSTELDTSQPSDSERRLELQCLHYLKWLGQSEEHIHWLLKTFPGENVVSLALAARRRFEQACLDYKRDGDTDETLTVQIQRSRLLENLEVGGGEPG